MQQADTRVQTRHNWVRKMLYWELCKKLKFDHNLSFTSRCSLIGGVRLTDLGEDISSKETCMKREECTSTVIADTEYRQRLLIADLDNLTRECLLTHAQ